MDRFAYGRRRRLPRTPVLAAALSVLLFCGVAAASWTVQGHGTGRAHAGAMLEFTINPTEVAVDGDLVPGGMGDLAFSVYNPNNHVLQVTDLEAGDVRLEDDPLGDPSLCLVQVDQVAIDSQVVGELLAARAETEFHVGGGVMMGEEAPTSCQDAYFEIDLTGHASS